MFAILNGAILMNFHNNYYKLPISLFFLIFFTAYSIYNPKQWVSLIFSCCFSIYYLLEFFPRIGNHSVVILFASICVLLLFILKIFNKKTLLNPNFLSYFFRIFTVTIYFYTGFHKFNTDFFNTCVSCVNEINEYTLSSVLGFPFKVTESFSRFFQISALILECIVPFGILFHKTRKYSIIILLLFHSYLALSVFADFSSVALFLLVGCMIDFEENVLSNKTILVLRFYLTMIILSVLFPFLLLKTTILKSQYDFIKGVVFLFGYITFIFHFLRNYTIKKQQFHLKYFLSLFLVFITISFWTLKSYIGLGNAGNLTMFSNLVTEKSMNNHFLIDTKKTKIFNFEEDNVYIVKMENPFVREKYNGYKIPVSEFRFLVNYWSTHFEKPIPCELIYKNKKYTFEDIKTSEFKETKWWYKYLSFRIIQTTSPNKCRW